MRGAGLGNIETSSKMKKFALVTMLYCIISNISNAVQYFVDGTFSDSDPRRLRHSRRLRNQIDDWFC